MEPLSIAAILLLTYCCGVVYGFAGFGAALIFLPVSTIWVPLPVAIVALGLSASTSLVTLVPQAWPHANKRAVFTMMVAALLAAPVGILGLKSFDTELLRYLVSGAVALTLCTLLAGIKFKSADRVGSQAAVGAGAGLLGGLTGLVGPIVVLFQLGTGQDVAQTRANSVCFLTITSALLIPLLALQGQVTWEAIVLGLSMMIPYGLGGWTGRMLFTPERKGLYTRVAYVLIGASAIAGLPLFS